MAESKLDRFVAAQGWMEPVADALQNLVGGFYRVLGAPGRGLKDLLHGTILMGHPLHPAATDIPLGAWIVGFVADWAAMATSAVPTQAGDLALAVGLAGALVSIASGLTDYHETYGHERRVATTHGLTMVLVFVIEAVSLGLRWGAGPSAHLPAVILATIGLALVLFGAYIGGHLTFGMGTMVNRTAFLEMPEDYVAVGKPEDFPEGEMRRVDAGTLAVLIVRMKGQLHAIANTCSHAGGPLNEGVLEDGIVTCPWHASRFCVLDGSVKGGPATFSQPQLLVREQDGQVEVRPAVNPH